MAVFTHLHSLQIEVQLEKKKLSRERMCYLTPLPLNGKTDVLSWRFFLCKGINRNSSVKLNKSTCVGRSECEQTSLSVIANL